MSVRTIELRAPYVLDVGQNLLDQPPFDELIRELSSDTWGVDTLRKVLLLGVKTGEPELPRGIQPKSYPHIASRLRRPDEAFDILDKMALKLAPFPRHLDYLARELGDPYGEDGVWVGSTSRGRSNGENIFGPMDTARTYCFWISMRQRLGIQINEEPPLGDAQVTGLLCRYNVNSALGEVEPTLFSDKELRERRTRLFTPRTWRIALNQG